MIDQYEVVEEPSVKVDSTGPYYYLQIAGWKSLADKQRNAGVEREINNRTIRAQLFNDFKIRYQPSGVRIISRDNKGVREGLVVGGKWVPILDLDRQTEPLWQREPFTRDLEPEYVSSITRYLTRIANNADYIQKIDDSPDRRGTTLNLQVAAAGDDGNEREGGLGYNTGTNQLRMESNTDTANRWWGATWFDNVTVPSGATVDGADWVVYSENSTTFTDYNLDIHCEDVDDSDDFTTTADIVGRTLTTASTAWVEDNATINAWHTHDITTAVAEVVARGGWASGNAMMVIGKGKNAALKLGWVLSYDDTSSLAAKLDIDYTAGGGGANPKGVFGLALSGPLQRVVG